MLLIHYEDMLKGVLNEVHDGVDEGEGYRDAKQGIAGHFILRGYVLEPVFLESEA
jgi:hypothetical protein